ncbi:uncharacterized protein [Battus philenor]|uniref:uncharacterized protein isoform X2 n=1 Tax=Battus philenor TaxID=42288 RepID=UPI0035D0AEE8
MAPPPEYDKEPKAPDKSVTNISTDDSKVLYNLVKDQQNNSDHKSSNAAANADIENNKHVGALDDGQLRALLDEAIAYKRPKDREGKSSLFKELLEEVEQDEQACEAAARGATGRRGARGAAGHGRRALPHSNSLQDLMAAALAAEPPRQRAHPHPPPASVSTRAHHGGSLPSGVDTSFMLSEEPARGGYLATVRCVNPPPLAERRVSASDANAPAELEHLNRSKPMFPVTYTARATLEIGSSSVCSGRAVTTTTPSNQITPHTRTISYNPDAGVQKTISNMEPNTKTESGGAETKMYKFDYNEHRNLRGHGEPQSQSECSANKSNQHIPRNKTGRSYAEVWTKNLNNWYEGLNKYIVNKDIFLNRNIRTENMQCFNNLTSTKRTDIKKLSTFIYSDNNNNKTTDLNPSSVSRPARFATDATVEINTNETTSKIRDFEENPNLDTPSAPYKICIAEEDSMLRMKYKERVNNDLVVPTQSALIHKNIRSTTIGHQQEDTFNQTQKCIDTEVEEDCTKTIVERGETQKNQSVTIFDDYDVRDATDQNLSFLAIEDMSKFNMVLKCNSKTEISFPQSSLDVNSVTSSLFVNKQQKMVDPDHTITDQVTDDLSKDVQVELKNENSCDTLSEENDKLSETVFNITTKNYKKADSDVGYTDNGETGASHHFERSDNTNASLTLSPICYNSSSTNIAFKTASYISDAETKASDTVLNERITLSESPTDPDKVQRVTKSKTDKRTKKALTVLLYENLFERADKFMSVVKAINEKEVDSTIPFSCITTPEVVASCNTTSSTAQSVVAIDPKPLQLGSCYRAVSCLTGEEPPPDPVPPAQPAPPDAPPATPAHLLEQPRSVVSSSLNGLPLSRPGYGSGAGAATSATTSTDDCKKSLDENGNAVQGFSSPLSGSSQQKKPRRKKSSKNETVIKSQEIDGYQGNKDLNEVLRFIESNAETTRGNKVRAKHKDDDDKGKKRSTERRKDKENKMKRATSLEELSRTKLEDLTDKPAPRVEPAKPERRSWGDDAREPRDFCPDAVELTDFQTVTKKRKPKRRADEPEPQRRARPPAPPSDRSNDSNDDMDSVHSLHSLHSLPPDAPPTRPAPPPHASYADIARTRHNIPDLIESCNFYESEVSAEPKRTEPPPTTAVQTGDDYPALETRKKRDKPRPQRKERVEAPRTGDCPAPDVVSDRRPAVILLDCASQPRDMDGVTFGFDINEQLVGGGRRPRCDLVRDALEGAVAVAVAAGAGALRYVPPPHAHDAAHLHQIVDYVGAAWEDVVRCGGAKVRYFSE